jgi:hypothetical protein
MYVNSWGMGMEVGKVVMMMVVIGMITMGI